MEKVFELNLIEVISPKTKKEAYEPLINDITIYFTRISFL